MMTTMHHLGHEPGRARLVASGVGSPASMPSWRAATALGRSTTGLPAFPTNADASVTGHATQPCPIKRPTRSLGTRST